MHRGGRLFDRSTRWLAAALVGLMVLGSFTEGIGILLLVPLLELLQGGAPAHPLATRLFAVFERAGLPGGVAGVLLAFVGLMVLRSLVHYVRQNVGSGLQHRVVDALRERCYRALLGAEWRWIAQGRRSDHASLLLTDITRVGMLLQTVIGLLAALATMAAYLVVAFVLDPAMAAVALASGLLVLAALHRQRRQAQTLGQQLVDSNRALQGSVDQSLTGIKLAKILGNERRHLEFFLDVVRRLRDRQLRFVASSSLSHALVEAGGAALLAGYLLVGLTLLATPLAELLVLVLLFSRLIPMFSQLQQLLQRALHTWPAYRETFRLLDAATAHAEPDVGGSAAGIPGIASSISLQGVSVTYAGRESPALDAVSITLPVRTTTAIVGASGAGKSTLADVLMGLLVPDSGVLAIDGTPLSPDARRRWRGAVAYVPQETFLFHDTIRNNLLWGNPAADAAVLETVLDQAAAEFVHDLPDGLDTVVGDGGVRLSGGERQRIALARALLKRPALVILDEATSALDLDNETRVREAIEKLHGNLTVVIIGHRLAMLEHADQVVRLERGRVVACGSGREIYGADEAVCCA